MTATLAPRRAGDRTVAWLYTAALLVGAALVFAVQPLLARMLLPVVGGTPALWTVALAFFQVALLLGYGYAHLSLRLLGPRRQPLVHAAVLLATCVLLPIGVPAWSPPTGGSTAAWVAAALAVGVGLPFVLLAATAPLLQGWFARLDHPRARDPYFLYRASNAGSLAGLLSYPVVVEPRLGLDGQALVWSAVYGALALLIGVCAMAVWRAGEPSHVAARPPHQPAPAWSARLGWFALAAVPASLLVAVTAKLTTDLAPVPLLWVIPLALYLVSFIVAFTPGRRGTLAYRAATWLFPPAGVLLAWVLATDRSEPVRELVLLHFAVLLLAGVVCHGRLARGRPAPEHLTTFYIWLAGGGAAAGLLNAAVAPVVFDQLTELPLSLALAFACLPWWGSRRLRAAVATLAAVGVFVVAWAAGAEPDVLERHRSFFGVLEVRELPDGSGRELRHGTTRHGAQLAVGREPPEPITYYHRSGPAGRLPRTVRAAGGLRTAAVVGLGVGSMACHARAGERWDFIDVDPGVERIARDPRHFTFLRDCPGSHRVTIGDGRVVLGRARPTAYDLIVIDAFSSDAIPVHLLTREAVALYATRLRPGGLLALHISNRFVDLEQPLGDVARANGLQCSYILDSPFDRRGRQVRGKSYSEWVVLARTREDLGTFARWSACATDPQARTWTDDYVNLWGAMRILGRPGG
jgi:hypothetical protein